MKTLQVTLILALLIINSEIGFAQLSEKAAEPQKVSTQSDAKPQNLIGMWRDSSTTFTIKEDKSVSLIFTNGLSKLGKWSSDGNKVEFSFDSGSQIYKYLILELTPNKLRYKREEDQTVWEAVKQD